MILNLIPNIISDDVRNRKYKEQEYNTRNWKLMSNNVHISGSKRELGTSIEFNETFEKGVL